MTPHWNCPANIVLMKGHNIAFFVEKQRNYLGCNIKWVAGHEMGPKPCFLKDYTESIVDKFSNTVHSRYLDFDYIE